MISFANGQIFDGETLWRDRVLMVRDGQVVGLASADQAEGEIVDLNGDIVAPGYVDLQVNGGDGVLLNEAPSVDTMRRMAKAHRSLGATTILPTLITDAPEVTRAAIAAAVTAIDEGVRGIGGLHLEGPHLSVARKGAHDPKFIRPMTDEDLQELLNAAAKLPVLLLTIAPENVTEAQVQTLAEAGVLVSIGHSDADFDTAMAYQKAGARCVTHLFNANSQLGNREPGIVGATLENGGLWAGMIADGIHVHPSSMRAAWAAKRGPGEIFLVSDSMAVAGTEVTEFTLNGRKITRRDGKLNLESGSLAGADLDLTTAVKLMVEKVGVSLEAALRAATFVPARLAGMPETIGQLAPGARDIIRIDSELNGCMPL